MKAAERRDERAGQLLLALAALALAGSVVAHPAWFFFLGISHYDQWFLDLGAIFASNDAVALGHNPYAYNPLDFFGRPHVYSHWWLGLRYLHLTRAAVPAAGCLLAGGFLVAAVAGLRPRSLAEWLWCLLLLGSPGVIFAVERGNNDLVLFIILAPLVPCLMSRRRGARLAAVALVALAAGLKFFPAAAALLLLFAPVPRTARWGLAWAAFALALVALSVGKDLLLIAPFLPRPSGLMTFGAATLVEAWGVRGTVAALIPLLVAAAVGPMVLKAGLFDGWRHPAATEKDWLGFILGAVLLTACFFSGTHYAYRWIFALWTAPFLWRVPLDAGVPRAVRILARVTGILLVVNLWADSAASFAVVRLAGHWPDQQLLRWIDGFVQAEQPVVWALFLCFAAFLADFTWQELSRIGPAPRA